MFDAFQKLRQSKLVLLFIASAALLIYNYDGFQIIFLKRVLKYQFEPFILYPVFQFIEYLKESFGLSTYCCPKNMR